MSLPIKAKLIHIRTNEVVDVYATKDHHNASEYCPVWVDEDGKYYGEVGLQIEEHEIIAEVFI